MPPVIELRLEKSNPTRHHARSNLDISSSFKREGILVRASDLGVVIDEASGRNFLNLPEGAPDEFFKGCQQYLGEQVRFEAYFSGAFPVIKEIVFGDTNGYRFE